MRNPKMWIPVYKERDPHFPALRHFMGDPEYVDSCLYMEGFRFYTYNYNLLTFTE